MELRREKEVQELENSGEDEAGKGILDSEAEPVERNVAREILGLSGGREKARTPFKEIADENGDNGEGRGNGQSEAASFEVVETPDIKYLPGGPFSTSLKIVKDREKRIWFRKKRQGKRRKKVALSLQELSLRWLARNADRLVSLDHVPDHLRYRL